MSGPCGIITSFAPSSVRDNIAEGEIIIRAGYKRRSEQIKVVRVKCWHFACTRLLLLWQLTVDSYTHFLPRSSTIRLRRFRRESAENAILEATSDETQSARECKCPRSDDSPDESELFVTRGGRSWSRTIFCEKLNDSHVVAIQQRMQRKMWEMSLIFFLNLLLEPLLPAHTCY